MSKWLKAIYLQLSEVFSIWADKVLYTFLKTLLVALISPIKAPSLSSFGIPIASQFLGNRDKT